MPTTNITCDSETGKRIAIIRNETHEIRVIEYCDGPARCSLLPSNPRHACTPFPMPQPMKFDEAVAHCSTAA